MVAIYKMFLNVLPLCIFVFINPGRSLSIFIRVLVWKTIVGEDKETGVDITRLQAAHRTIGDNSVAIQGELYDKERFDVIL